MKVLSTNVPIFTGDIDAAIEQYEALTRETVRERCEIFAFDGRHASWAKPVAGWHTPHRSRRRRRGI
jgi:hypothetical protein